MRAEGQAHIDRIESALALVRKFLVWDRAVRRLDELNARVEDPRLWDDPKGAEAVMRERRRDQERDAADQGRKRLWLCQDRKRRAPAGADQSL